MRKLYDFIQSCSKSYPIRTLCCVLEVSKSAYYNYRSGKSYQPSMEKQNRLAKVKTIFDCHKGRYGSRRIQSVLQDEGAHIGLYQVRSLMRAQDLIALQPKRFVPQTTQSHPHLRRSTNLLLDPEYLPNSPNKVWVGDITYLPSGENGEHQWLYLAVWMDLFSRKLVGWCVDKHMEESLVIRALKQGIRNRQPTEGLIIHADGGGQYASKNFKALLARNTFRQSMTRRDNHYDNAHIESLFGRFKTEVLLKDSFKDLVDAKWKVFDFIAAYYNTIRKHSALGYKSPMQFEEKHWQDVQANKC